MDVVYACVDTPQIELQSPQERCTAPTNDAELPPTSTLCRLRRQGRVLYGFGG